MMFGWLSPPSREHSRVCYIYHKRAPIPTTLNVRRPKNTDATVLLTIGGFLLTVELCCLQLIILAFLLTVGAFSLTV